MIFGTITATKRNRILVALCLATLVLWPLRHVWLGVELTDSAYSAGNYALLDSLDPMWLFSTYLANLLGAFLIRMPGGHTMMGLNSYTALTVSILALICFTALVRYLKVSYGIAFLGVFVAESLCWCPTTILYNYLTYLFFNLAVILVYVGLRFERRSLLLLAGVIFGFNFWVRFPNIVECILIVAVWYYGYLVHKRARDVVQETLLCIAGFVLGAGIWMLQVLAVYGWTAYIDAINRLLSMPSEASDYSLYSMLLTPILDYKASARWLLCMVVTVLVMTLIIAVLKFRIYRILQAVMLIGIAAMYAWWYKLGVFNVRYYTYESMFQWVSVFLIVTIIWALHDLIVKEVDRGRKLYALCVLVIIFATPLGSNNHLYPNINNLFLVAPYTLQGIWELFFGRQTDDGHLPGRLADVEWVCRERLYPSFPLKAMIVCFTLALVIQSVGFGCVFTFRDGMSGQIRDTKIEKNAILKGMVTNAELAAQLEGLTVYMEESVPGDRKVILYGQIPALSFYLNRTPAISTIWPDLRSYTLETFCSEIDRVEAQGDTERPVIIISAAIDAYLTDDAEGMELIGVTESMTEGYKADEKLAYLTAYMERNGYTETYSNTGFAVYE